MIWPQKIALVVNLPFWWALSGSVVGAFTVTLETIVVLAAFIPVISDMGGNVATQSSTVFVRAGHRGDQRQ